MFGRKRLCCAVVLILCGISAQAIAGDAEGEKPTSSPVFNKFSCFPFNKQALYDFEVSAAGVRVNNLNIANGKEFITDSPTLALSAAVANRSEVNVSVSVEVVGMSGGSPVFALSGNIPFGYIAPDKNDEIKSAVVVSKDTLTSAETLCIRVSGYRKKG